MNKEIKFNAKKQNKIKEMIAKKQFRYARESALTYLKDYPKDPLVKNLLGITYLYEGNFDIAEQCFYSNIGTSDERYAKFHLIKILIEKREYEQAYQYCVDILPTIKDKLTRKDIKRTINYIREVLSPTSNISSYSYESNYLCNQINNYDINKTYEHIKKHQTDDPDNDKAVFNKDIDLEKLLTDINERIQTMKEVYYPIRLTGNCYYFHYPNIGSSKERISNYIRVITIPNSKNIITIYPVFDNDVYDIENTEDLYIETKLNHNNEKIKARTGLERFNAKYKRK